MRQLNRVFVGLLLAGVCGSLLPVQAQPTSGAGLSVEEAASEAQLGLPLYPKAQLVRDGKNEAGAFSMALWGGAFGLRMAVAQYRSTDGLQTVADFYRKAMALHGPVLECRPGSAPPAAAPKAPEGALSCREAEPPAGGVVLKVGRAKNQRVVVLTPKGQEVQLQLVRIEAKGD